MEVLVKKVLLTGCCGIVLGLAELLYGADETPIFPDHARIKVQYQAKHPRAGSWTVFSAVLKDARTESMLENQLLQRHPGYAVRILSASAEKDIQVVVRYQIRRNSPSWTAGTATLRNALTESMARNQIAARYSGSEVRILSMIFK